MENCIAVLQKTKDRTSVDPAVPLGMYQKEMQSAFQGTLTFVAVLFIIARIWNQLKCLLTDEWLMWSYYAAMKKNVILSFAASWGTWRTLFK